MEKPNRYNLLINWKSIEDHTIGFRQSKEYLEWKRLLTIFMIPFRLLNIIRKSNY